MKRSALFIALLAATSFATAAPWIYRGTLNDGGKPANGAYDLRLTLINTAGTASISQPITLSNVAVKDGNFAAEVDFGFDLTNAPALKLKTEVQQNGSGFASLAEPSAFDAKAALAGICWDTTGNVVAAGEFLGSTNNVPLVLKANNVEVLRMSGGLAFGAANIVAGSPSNTVNPSSFGQTISGGGFTQLGCGPSNTTCGNTSSGSYASIGGGFGNSAAGLATVGGGEENSATGNRTTVSGGKNNSASASFATISGGTANAASAFLSTVSGGEGNVASGSYTYVGGGRGNKVSGVLASIGGGDGNIATGRLATISGGGANCAGGDNSWAGGTVAKIRPGNEVGDGTCAINSGDADGDNGTFVWADDQNISFVSSGPNQFLVRAAGGMAINTNTPTAGAALTVAGNVSIPAAAVDFGATTRQMINLWGGATGYGIGVQGSRQYFRVPNTGGFNWFVGGAHSDTTDSPGAGGAWRMHLSSVGNLLTSTGTIGTLSDARLKDHVVDYTHSLDRINALRPVNYHYKAAGTAAFQPIGEHVGFIAQEMQQVFPNWVLQGDDGYLQLSMRGFEAVAVRAMQELSAENTALRQELTAINAAIKQLQADAAK